ncbi:hypothetical protein EG329_001229 [Mollisiaceae sp. DMI_Dod_QoI]|nr:hypothetical protein EG329_001229 [Helotiales sp. DMI_Dod_QoI]
METTRVLRRLDAGREALSPTTPESTRLLQTLLKKKASTAQQSTSKSNKITKYQYSPLNEDLHEIRLLHLLPGIFPDPIHLELEAVSFTHDNVPKFEALSYAWGSEENPADVFIGESDDCKLAITKNLAEALPYLRDANVARVFWIDAICVNQKDLEERSKQVQRMADIFSKAHRVVVWLGSESDDSDLAIDCIERASSQIKVNWSKLSMESITDNTDWSDMNTPPDFQRHEFLALSNFLSRSWFQRLWVWQEIRLPSHNPNVLCGTRRVSWVTLRNAVFCLYFKRLPSHFLRVLEEHLARAYELCTGQETRKFGRLIHQTRHCKCSDPRDRVFALLSLVDPDSGMTELKSSYARGIFEVYQEAMLHWSRRFGNLNLLCTVEMHDNLQGVPSWVPNWADKRVTAPLELGLTGGLSAAMIPKDIDKILQLTGVVVGKIETVEEFRYPNEITHRRDVTAQGMCEVISSLGITGPFECGSKLVQDLCAVVTANNFAERYYPPDFYFPTREGVERALCHALNYQFISTERRSPGDDTADFSKSAPSEDKAKVEVTNLTKMKIRIGDNFGPESSATSKPDIQHEIVVQHSEVSNSNISPDSTFPQIRDTEQAPLLSLNEITLNGLSPKELETFDYVFKNCAHRSLFKSNLGHIGLAPAEAKPGDIITALLGCPSAMILRHMPHSDQYKIVGEAFCQGTVYGEALLGPLPQFIEPISYYDENTRREGWVFFDQDTKSPLEDDPRLGELPAEWRRERYGDQDKGPFSRFVNVNTGEMLDGPDPRMSPEALRERGVDLRVFGVV